MTRPATGSFRLIYKMLLIIDAALSFGRLFSSRLGIVVSCSVDKFKQLNEVFAVREVCCDKIIVQDWLILIKFSHLISTVSAEWRVTWHWFHWCLFYVPLVFILHRLVTLCFFLLVGYLDAKSEPPSSVPSCSHRIDWAEDVPNSQVYVVLSWVSG